MNLNSFSHRLIILQQIATWIYDCKYDETIVNTYLYESSHQYYLHNTWKFKNIHYPHILSQLCRLVLTIVFTYQLDTKTFYNILVLTKTNSWLCCQPL